MTIKLLTLIMLPGVGYFYELHSSPLVNKFTCRIPIFRAENSVDPDHLTFQKLAGSDLKTGFMGLVWLLLSSVLLDLPFFQIPEITR